MQIKKPKNLDSNLLKQAAQLQQGTAVVNVVQMNFYFDIYT